MAHASEPRLLAVHGLRIKGFAEPDVVAAAVGLAPEMVASELARAEADGLVIRREGRMSGYSLTAEGRAENERMLAAELDQAGVRDVVEHAYKRFLAKNGDLLAICTAWQMRERDGTSEVNDHRDPAYDAEVIGRLVALHDEVRPIVVELRDALERFGRYATELREALEKLAGGARDYFTKPMFPSYHTVWFELHEDLLATLGIDRASEVEI